MAILALTRLGSQLRQHAPPAAHDDDAARQNNARAMPAASGTNTLERLERDFDYAL